MYKLLLLLDGEQRKLRRQARKGSASMEGQTMQSKTAACGTLSASRITSTPAAKQNLLNDCPPFERRGESFYESL